MGKLALSVMSLYQWETAFANHPRLVRGWIAQVIRHQRKASR